MRMITTCIIVALGLTTVVSFQYASPRTRNSPAWHRNWQPYKFRTSALEASPSMDILSAVDDFYRNTPYEAAFLTCGVKAASSDAIAQRAVEKVNSFSVKRNAAFITYGGLYQGIAQYVIFNELYPIMFGSGTDVFTVAEKVIFDQLVLTPFLCLPIAYLVKAAVFQYSAKEALSRYVKDAKKDLLWKYWAIWTPTQCLTFSVVPEHLRIAFIAAVSFVWLIILSNIASRNEKDTTQSTTGTSKTIICYDNECLIVEELDFAGPASLINEDASDAGVRLGPEGSSKKI